MQTLSRNELLQYGYDTATKAFNEEQILGIYAENSEQPRFVILYLPTFAELCLSAPCTTKHHFYKDNAEFFVEELRTINTHNKDIAATLYIKANPQFEDSFQKLKDIFYRHSLYELEHNDIIAQTIVQILYDRYCVNKVAPQIRIKEFVQSLSVTEKTALSYLSDQQQYYSIVKLIEASHISRPVFKNLLDKMGSFNIAKIENKGVKGTFIDFFDYKGVLAALQEV